MHGCEDHATGTDLKQLPQMFHGFCLHGLLPQDFTAALKLTKQLVVQVIPVRQHHQRGVLHRRMADHQTRIEQHRQALATSLSVPDHAATMIAGLAPTHAARPESAFVLRKHFRRTAHSARPNGFLHGCTNRMELMVSGKDLEHAVAVRIVFEHDEIPDQLEKMLLLEHASNQNLQRQLSFDWAIVIDGRPWLEPFYLCRQ